MIWWCSSSPNWASWATSWHRSKHLKVMVCFVQMNSVYGMICEKVLHYFSTFLEKRNQKLWIIFFSKWKIAHKHWLGTKIKKTLRNFGFIFFLLEFYWNIEKVGGGLYEKVLLLIKGRRGVKKKKSVGCMCVIMWWW